MRTILLAAFAAPALMLGGCGTQNRGLESVHQPVVSRTDYVFDVRRRRRRLGRRRSRPRSPAGWRRCGSAMATVSRSTIPTATAPARRDDVAGDRRALRPAARRRRAGHRRAGRRRARSASSSAGRAPACRAAPISAAAASTNSKAARTSNYGCATNTNLAAMVADPVDLVRGQPGTATIDAAHGDQGDRRLSQGRADRRRRHARQGRARREASKMNAPWKPAGAAHRDPFVAYVCDETTAEALRPIASELGWSAEKVQQGRAAQRGPVAVGLGQPANPVRRSGRIAAIR